MNFWSQAKPLGLHIVWTKVRWNNSKVTRFLSESHLRVIESCPLLCTDFSLLTLLQAQALLLNQLHKVMIVMNVLISCHYGQLALREISGQAQNVPRIFGFLLDKCIVSVIVDAPCHSKQSQCRLTPFQSNWLWFHSSLYSRMLACQHTHLPRPPSAFLREAHWSPGCGRRHGWHFGPPGWSASPVPWGWRNIFECINTHTHTHPSARAWPDHLSH